MLEHNKNVFSIQSFTTNISNISTKAYLIGHVSDLKSEGILIQNKNIAGSFNNISYCNGTGFYITHNIINEYNRIAEPSISSPGALRYIDGCSNTEIVSPVKLGWPSINYLHVPSNIKQTSHIHKSDRVGLVIDGEGYAVTPTDTHILTKNTMFVLPAYEHHYFETVSSSLSIVVFHPDSDIGPTDEINNMKIRTHT